VLWQGQGGCSDGQSGSSYESGSEKVTWVSEFAVKLVASTPPKPTSVVCVRLTPVIVTCVPTAPLVGLKLRSCGRTRNGRLLVKVPLGVVTITGPVVAPAGTVAFR
jgi:hypothetical protein